MKLHKLCKFVGAQCYKNNVSPEQLAALQEYIVQPPPAICQEFSALATSVMQRDGLTMPNTANEGLSLYKHLVKAIEDAESSQ